MSAIVPFIQDAAFITVASFIFRFVIYLIAAGVGYFLIWKLLYRFSEKRQIYKSVPQKRQMLTEFQGSMRTVLIWGVMSVPAYYYIVSGSRPNKLGPMLDPWYVHVAWFVALLVIHDTYFYWMHRMMHHPKLYKRFHAYHHKSMNPSPWAIFSFDAAEAIIHFSIGYVFLFFFPCHMLVTLAWFVAMVAYNVLGHIGFEFFPNWIPRNRLLGLSNTSTHHALHHKYFSCNYGLYFTFWDRVMGTEHPDYLDLHQGIKDGKRI